MDLLPGDFSEFRSQHYWNKFFNLRRGRAFEWYGEWPELKPLLLSADCCGFTVTDCDRSELPGGMPLANGSEGDGGDSGNSVRSGNDRSASALMKSSPGARRLHVLVPGCGNSELSAHLLDVLGPEAVEITSIDFSPVVIAEMRKKHGKQRPRLKWEVMDMTATTFCAGHFHVVVDKGSLDAVMGEPGPEAMVAGRKYLKELTRLLHPSMGRYLCITLGQEHVIELLLHSFRHCWSIAIHTVPVPPADASPLRPFLLIIKRQPDTLTAAPSSSSSSSTSSILPATLPSVSLSFTSDDAISQGMDVEQMAGFFDVIGRENRLRSTLSAASQSDLQPSSQSDARAAASAASAASTAYGAAAAEGRESASDGDCQLSRRGGAHGSRGEAGGAEGQAGRALNGATSGASQTPPCVGPAAQAELDTVLANLSSFQPGRRVVLQLAAVSSVEEEEQSSSRESESAGGQGHRKSAAVAAAELENGNGGRVAFRVVEVSSMASDTGGPLILSPSIHVSPAIASSESVAAADSSSSHQQAASGPPIVPTPLSPSSRFAAVLLDALPETLPPTALPCTVFLVPQGLHRDWLYSQPEGQWELIKSANALRLIIVSLHPLQLYGPMPDIQEELSSLLPPLLPKASRKTRNSVPFVTAECAPVKGREIDCIPSPLTGPILIVDQQQAVAATAAAVGEEGRRASSNSSISKAGQKQGSANSQYGSATATATAVPAAAIVHRRMVFERNRNLVQSEAILVPVADAASDTGTEGGGGIVEGDEGAAGAAGAGKRVGDSSPGMAAGGGEGGGGGGGGGGVKEACSAGVGKRSGRQARREAAKAGVGTSGKAPGAGSKKASAKKGGRSPGGEGTVSVRLVVDHSRLASEYHVGMVAGLAVMKERVVRAVEEKRFQGIVIGLGGGALPMFLRKHIPFSRLLVAELDATISRVAEQHFAFASDSVLQLHIGDGVALVQTLAAQLGGKHSGESSLSEASGSTGGSVGKTDAASLDGFGHADVIFVDADSDDVSTGMSCPAEIFLSEPFLRSASTLLHPDGMLAVNVVARSQTQYARAVQCIKQVFTEVHELNIDEDVNRVLFAKGRGGPPASPGHGSGDVIEGSQQRGILCRSAIEIVAMSSKMAPWGNGPSIFKVAGNIQHLH